MKDKEKSKCLLAVMLREQFQKNKREKQGT